ncbi:MAG: TRAP transporter large permease subunit, partial [Pseudomonadota bacterium]
QYCCPAILPGLIAVTLFVAVIALQVHIKPDMAPLAPPLEPTARADAIWRLGPVLAIFGSIIIGLGLGLFTPTPAAAVGASLILAYGLFRNWRRPGYGLTSSGMRASLLETAKTSGMIYLIVFGAEVLKGFFARAGLPAAMAAWTGNSGLDPWTILVLMLALLIILGCFMESLAMILVVVPFLWPALVALNGGDYTTADTAAFGMTNEELKIWFGILALVVVELGLITPPVGLNIFIIASIAKTAAMRDVFAGVLPFIGAEMCRIALLLAVPGLCLLLPRLL